MIDYRFYLGYGDSSISWQELLILPIRHISRLFELTKQQKEREQKEMEKVKKR